MTPYSTTSLILSLKIQYERQSWIEKLQSFMRVNNSLFQTGNGSEKYEFGSEREQNELSPVIKQTVATRDSNIILVSYNIKVEDNFVYLEINNISFKD